MMLGESVQRRQPRRRKGPGGARSWKVWLPAILAALVLPFAIGYAFAVLVLFPEPEFAEGGIPVPVLVGESIGEAEQALSAAGLGSIDALELPHPSAPAGQVLAQSPLPGQQLHTGGNVRVSVSAGRPRVLVPDVAGFSAERAEQLLRRFGFDVTRREREGDLAAGRVLATEPAAGHEARLPATVMLLVSTGPPPPPELPMDTGLVPSVPEPPQPED
jgi:beta-lactam-binding protein with PASTA domain